MMELFGKFDENIRLLEEEFGVQIIARQTQLRIIGNEKSVDMAFTVLNKLLEGIEDGTRVDKSRVRYLTQLVKAGETDHIVELTGDVICVTYKGKQIKCKTLGQAQYVNAMRQNDIVFGIGPAGTGKTYLAMAMAVNAFKNKEVSRIILTRPAVEAGEKLGFLPGDLQNKVDPYLRPLYDALHDLMGLETYTRLIDRGVIEVAPLAYMRGRTLDDAFIILDEAQNTTSEQMKMFLTRLGIGSKAVINGDITQIDLVSGAKSGLVEASEILKGINGIGFVRLTHSDVVRHELVMSIIRAYDNYHRRKKSDIS
ncbi:MAG TPA: PhoH family protein [Clostridiales bacterium]|jgi:phosphate starvation-inducible PhoH-like protein|nr:PhoH family protein [Clostridiales bacterium]